MSLTVVDQGLLSSTAQYTGFKNRIINGGMGIWQRGTTFTLAAGTPTYVSDRFVAYTNNTATVVSQSTDVPAGYKYSNKVQRPVSNTGVNTLAVSQMVESNNMLDLQGQSVTLSFWAKAGANYSTSGSFFAAQVYSGTVADQGSASFYAGTWTGLTAVISSSVALTTSWQKFQITGTVPSNSLELGVYLSAVPTGTAGADDSFYITGVQLEKGSTATSFDYRPYGTELALCQRYYAKTFPQTVAPAQNVASVDGTLTSNSTTTSASSNVSRWDLPNVMRASPTVTTFNPYSAASGFSNAGSGNYTAATYAASDRSVTLREQTGGVGAGAILLIHATASAEL